MPSSRIRHPIAALVLALACMVPRTAWAQDEPADEGVRTRIDVVFPLLGYARGGRESRHAWVTGARLVLRTETWGVGYTQRYWVTGWTCPRQEADVCDDPESYTLGVERRFARGDGVLVAGADAGVMRWYGSRAMADVRVGLEQPIPPLGAIRLEAQGTQVLGLDVATVGLFAGFRFSFGGPRLPAIRAARDAARGE